MRMAQKDADRIQIMRGNDEVEAGLLMGMAQGVEDRTTGIGGAFTGASRLRDAMLWV